MKARLRIGIVTPAPPGTRHGNRITALRWARILRQLGHRVSVVREYTGEPFDLLLALHALRSHNSICRFRGAHPERPLIVALTGTDLYRDLRRSARAQKSLGLACRIVALQPKALEELRPELREKARVILQSAGGKSVSDKNHESFKKTKRGARSFDVCVIGHLRPVKDPFRAALASRLLPRSSRIRVLHVGKAMTKSMEQRALKEMMVNARYRWIGELSRARARRLLARSDLFILSSKMEGGANVLSEAIAERIPVLASKIAGSVGLLGEDYPGYFAVGSSIDLARAMARAETDPNFLEGLTRWVGRLGPQFSPALEKQAWSRLLAELGL